jgi:zinc/manganese transport system substrate-binding protein
MRTLVAALGIALLTASCAGEDPEPGEGDTARIVVTDSIWGDVVASIVGDEVPFQVLVPIGADPHEFQPSARQVAAVESADLVIANGLGLEEGMADVLASARADGVRVLEVAPLLDPIPFGGDPGDTCTPTMTEDDHGSTDDDHGSTEDDHGSCDPHVWMDPTRMASAAAIIGEAIGAVEPSIDWSARAEAYASSMRATDATITEILAPLPADRRTLVTNHDALGYFAARYGFTVVGTIIPGGSSLGDPSSSELADLVEVMRVEGVRAIFADSTRPSVLADAVAAELGSDVVVVPLYTGSLGEPGSGAETVGGMLTVNAERIADALG